MDQGYKHFSHLHNLIMHEMPEGVEVSCSGCHSSATTTVYVCWQCNFFLHEQCYRATRSLKHPSHPPHPLTLVPYPTYHSNSFYCNSCEIIGTGFSYSCAECEFDLHVQCAYSISRATSFKNAHMFQELVPQGWNGMQDSNINHHVPFVSVSESLPIPFQGAQNHYMHSNSISGMQYQSSIPEPSVAHNAPRYYSMDETRPFVSIPTTYPQNMIPNSQDPSMPQDMPFVSIPTSSHNSSVQYPSMEQPTGPSDSIPTKYSQNPIPSSQDPSTPQTRPSARPSVSIPTSSHNSSVQYPSMEQQTGPSVSIPTSSHNSSAQYPSMAQTGPSDPSTPQNRPSDSIPTKYPQNPIPSAQDPSRPQHMPSVSIPTSSHNSSAQYPSMAQTGPSDSIPTIYPQNPIPSSQDPSTPQNRPSDSIPTKYPQNPIPSAQDPSTPQHMPSVSIPTSFHNSSTQYPSMEQQTGPSDSIPTIYPQNPIPISQDPSTPQTIPSVSIPTKYPQNPIPSAQDPSMPQHMPSVSIPTSSHNSSAQYPSMEQQTGPSDSIPTIYPQNPIPISQDPSTPQTIPYVSIPTKYPQNPIPSAQDPSTPQNIHSNSIPTSSHNSSVQYPSMEQQTGPSDSIPTIYPQNPIPISQDPSTPQNIPSNSIPTDPHNSVSVPSNPSYSTTNSQDPSVHQNGSKDKETMHFSHPHKLSRVSFQEDEEDEVICSGCEETLVGNGYSCVEPDCNFHLHESCFNLKNKIHHKSHPDHPLTLMLAPYDDKTGEFTCSACFSDGTGFTYHCSICEFDLHVQCVNLPETAKREDHEHMLKLLYACPVKDDVFSCDVCHGEVQKDRWGYYCEACDYGTHLGCVDCEECERDSAFDTQAELQRLQIRMQMARQQAEFMARLGASLSGLAG